MELPSDDTTPPETAAPQSLTARWEGLKVRALSAVAFAAVGLGLLWNGGWVFTLFVFLAALIMMREWNNLVVDNNAVERALGMFYVAIPCASLIWLRNVHIDGHANAGFVSTLYIIATISVTDIAAYFAGRQIGGPKLAPAISPNKTWAGLGGGVAAAAILGAISCTFNPFPVTFLSGLGLGAFLALAAQAGDLLESWMKRRAGVKDSGTLLP
ncbi:MAG: phosphatidate cytidylyltransferase, partial [Rhodobacteraceae bacterium]|nr:phosphatidate cytidylyltransferase [Paracoccaceae bacterium]